MDFPLGYSQIADLSTAKGLGAGSLGAIPAGSAYAVVVAEAQDVRWRDDATDPTGTVGMLLTKGTPFTYDGPLSKIKFIQTAATAKLNIAFYKSSAFARLASSAKRKKR
jgi:hypothetical protein